jgi:hypothetical protein
VKAYRGQRGNISLSMSKPSAVGKTSKFPAQVDSGVVEQREGKHVLDAGRSAPQPTATTHAA